jgi:hypothetical protein
MINIKAISGVDVKIADASATWTVISGWLTSTEGGLRWVKNISFFLVIVLISWILAVLLSKAAKKAVISHKEMFICIQSQRHDTT